MCEAAGFPISCGTPSSKSSSASRPRNPPHTISAKDLFGKHGSGRNDLSANRKAILDEILRAKHRRAGHRR